MRIERHLRLRSGPFVALLTFVLLGQILLGSCSLIDTQAHSAEGSAHVHHTTGSDCEHDPPLPDEREAAATEPRRAGDGPTSDEAAPSLARTAGSDPLAIDAVVPRSCGTRGPPAAGRTLLDTLGIART